MDEIPRIELDPNTAKVIDLEAAREVNYPKIGDMALYAMRKSIVRASKETRPSTEHRATILPFTPHKSQK